MLRTSLDTPDSPQWRHEVGYRPQLVQPLARAYGYLTQITQDPDAYFNAYCELVPQRSQSMSLRQRMRIEYVLAQAYTGENALSQALACLHDAQEMATLLQDARASILLSFLMGAVCHWRTQFLDARSHYQTALRTLRALEDDTGPLDGAFEVDLLIRIAGLDVELADLEAAEAHIHEAHTLIGVWCPTTPEAPAQLAVLAWLNAIHAQWSGDSDRALSLAIAAADGLAEAGVAGMFARLGSWIADIALDFAETVSLADAPRLRAAFVRRARRYAKSALAASKASNDVAGAEIAQLTLMRCQHLLGTTSHSIDVVAGIERYAQRRGNIGVLGRAYVALGDELRTGGDLDAARTRYAMARDLFDEYDFRVMRTWPARYL